jgi:von Willebrand factor type A domain/FHA domain
MNLSSHRSVRVLGGAACLWSVLCSTGAHADNRFLFCREALEGSPVILRARCELRPGDPVSRVTVGAGQATDAIFTANDSANPPTPVVFLLDQSGNTLTKGSFDRLRSVIGAILSQNLPAVSVGVYGFSNGVKPIAPVGTAPATAGLALEAIKQNGRGTNELLRSVQSVLDDLRGFQTTRKVLVILSDGRSEDPAYSVTEISTQLREGHVTVFAVAPGKSGDDLTDAQPMRRLAEDNQGEFLTASDGRGATDVARTLRTYLSGGGIVTFPITARETRLDVELATGKKLHATFISTLFTAPAAAAPPPAAPPEGSAGGRSAGTSWLLAVPVNAASWLMANRFHQLLLAIAVVAILCGLWFLRKISNQRRIRRAALSIAGRAEVAASVSDLTPPLARLEFLDGNESSETVHALATRIGRQRDNDIVLSNTSVHRHHAVLKKDAEGPFVIFDLNTVNGVLVNGARVTSASLQDGDLLELGEVRMRFRMP